MNDQHWLPQTIDIASASQWRIIESANAEYSYVRRGSEYIIHSINQTINSMRLLTLISIHIFKNFVLFHGELLFF